jgi:hypothetical protein
VYQDHKPADGSGFTSRKKADRYVRRGVAFIHYYTKVNGRPPAEADMQRYFRVTPPSVHQMGVTLEATDLLSASPAKGDQSVF